MWALIEDGNIEEIIGYPKGIRYTVPCWYKYESKS